MFNIDFMAGNKVKKRGGFNEESSLKPKGEWRKAVKKPDKRDVCLSGITDKLSGSCLR